MGVAAVLGYKPNSQTAQALLDITGANTTASTTPLDQPAATTTTGTSAPPSPAASTEPSAAAPATSAPAPKPSAKATAKATAKQSAAPASTPTPTATTAADPAPATTPTPAAPAKPTGSKTITGDAFNAISHGKDYGAVVAVVTITDGKITKITASQNPEGRNYPYIQAVRQYLIPAVLQAQKANVGYVSGATGTSEAFVQSVQSALNKA